MILIVDDNVPSAETLALLIGFSGHATEVAHTGAEALQVAERCHPAVILLDLSLPGMDGFEVARRLRASGNHESMLVAVTGYGQEDDRRRTSEAGFHHHLVKPIDFGQLEQILSNALPA